MVEEVKVFAPATIGNVGPGFDVLGLAISGLGDIFYARKSEHPSIKITGRDADLIPRDLDKNTVIIAAQEFCRLVGRSVSFELTINRHLPASGGLGSSASSSVAGAMIAAKLLGYINSQDLIIQAALYAETMVAGRHLDNIAPCVLGGLTIVQSIDPLQISKIPTSGHYFVVLVTPAIKINTAEARKALPTSLPQSDWVQELARVSSLVAGLATHNQEMITRGLITCFGEHYRKELVPGFDIAKQGFMELGATGFTISGAGPTCFAIFLEEPDIDGITAFSKQVFGNKTTVHLGSIEERGAYYS